MKKIKNAKKKGFTLIELIIVVAILGILAAIAVPRFGGVQEDAKKKADIASARTIADVATVLIAQGEIGTTIKDTNDTPLVIDGEAKDDAKEIADQLHNIPKSQVMEEYFSVSIDSNEIVKIYVGDKDVKNQVYPEPELKSDETNKWYDN